MRRNCSRAWAAALALALCACATPTVQQEQAIGDDFMRQVQSEVRLLREPVVAAYVEAIGRDLLRDLPPQPFEYHFYVVDDPKINAFAGPAGHVFVNTGTILRARNVSELAGVIAHEIGHVAERHVAENVARQRTAGLLHRAGVYAAAILAGPNAAGAANLGGGLAAMGVLNSFGREAEREADAFAVDALLRAGYDPIGLVTFFELLAREPGGGVPQFLSSHPAPGDRVETTRATIEAAGWPIGLRKTDGGRLEIIQRRICLLTATCE
jgi:predicted Zn-dependent protease